MRKKGKRKAKGLIVIDEMTSYRGKAEPKVLHAHKFVPNIGICDARSILPDLTRQQIDDGLAHLRGLRPGSQDASAFNEACDRVINRLLAESGITFDKKGNRIT